jgi:hypothetical protein
VSMYSELDVAMSRTVPRATQSVRALARPDPMPVAMSSAPVSSLSATVICFARAVGREHEWSAQLQGSLGGVTGAVGADMSGSTFGEYGYSFHPRQVVLQLPITRGDDPSWRH